MTTYVSTDPSVTLFVAAQNSGPAQRGSSAVYAPALFNNGIAGSSSDNVIGFSSLTASGTSPIAMGSGMNAVIIDGVNSSSAALSGQPDNFSFTVDTTGVVTLTDTTTGKTQQVSGVSFLIFDSAEVGTDSGGNSVYRQLYFIGDANQTEVTQLYNAAFGRQPDLGGVEYYRNEVKAGVSFQQIAAQFMASPEFQTHYGANLSDTQFVTNLYSNVLHRAPVQSEIDYYTAALANAAAGAIVNTTNPVAWSRAQELLNFTNSPENQVDTGGFVINSSASPTNGLVYSTPAAASLSGQTVLNQANATGNVDTTLIDPSTLTSHIQNSQVGIAPGGGGIVPATAVATGETGGTITLSPGVPDFVGGSNLATTVINGSASGGSFLQLAAGNVNLHGTGNNVFQYGLGLQPYNPSPIVTVTGFAAGDTLQFYTMAGGQGTYILLNPTSANPLFGSTLKGFAFGTVNSNEYIINVGAVGGGSAAEVAAAASKVYMPSDAFGEQAVFYGQITSGANAGGTAVFDWADATGAPSSADANANRLVDANEFTGGIILVGVASSTITTATFFHK